MLIQNTELHPHVALIADPFGVDGAVLLVPVEGDKLGRPFILDAQAARELAAFVDGLKPVEMRAKLEDAAYPEGRPEDDPFEDDALLRRRAARREG